MSDPTKQDNLHKNVIVICLSAVMLLDKKKISPFFFLEMNFFLILHKFYFVWKCVEYRESISLCAIHNYFADLAVLDIFKFKKLKT